MRLLTPGILLALTLLSPVVAQERPAEHPLRGGGPVPGSCELGTAQRDLSISDVRARLFNTGGLFFGSTSEAQYIVPEATGRSAIFAAGIWIGGKVNGELRTAAARYSDFEFWPGPLDPATARPVDPADCSPFDRIFRVSVLDVEAYEQGGPPTPDLADWPVGLGAPAVDANGDPVVPTSLYQIIDLEAGERPVIYGAEVAFWVMNDVGNQHGPWGTDPIGLEVRVSAFAIPDAGDPAFDRGTFYRYEVVNRNDQPFEDAYFSLFSDPDLGDAADDYAGSDPAREMAYVYNADNLDGGSNGYGTPPPAIGFDLLSGAASAMYFTNGGPFGTGDPGTAEEYYNVMQGLWTDGLPMRECGIGINCAGPETVWAFNGRPEAGTGWTEVGEGNAPDDRRVVVSSPAFTLAPGASRTFDLAIVFAFGGDHLGSVAELRGASDRVQAAYADETLFDTVDPSGTVEPPADAPALLAPPHGAAFTEGDVAFDWGPVAGASFYEVQVDTDPDFASPRAFTALGDALVLSPSELEPFQQDPFHWRVRAGNTGGYGPYSGVRAFTYFVIPDTPGWLSAGAGIAERAYPGVDDVCAGAPADPGCILFGGNTVWHDENATADYYLSTGNDGSLDALSRYVEAAVPDEFEVRFTDDGGLALYAFVGLPPFPIARVPFELWNIGPEEAGENDPADDVRMIPFLNANVPGNELTNWRNQFTGTDPWPESPCPDGCPITDWVYWMMPDRPNGYDLFEEAALGFGGPGALYDPTADGDDQVDVDPLTGEPCGNQGVYADYCYRNQTFINNPGLTQFIYPVGRLIFADLAGDGTTPPTGTVVRLITSYTPTVANEPGGGELPETYALSAVYPNPSRGRATVAYALPQNGRARVAVYDLLGREVAVLADGLHAVGRHEAALDGARLASGVYVVVLTGEGGARATAKVTLLR